MILGKPQSSPAIDWKITSLPCVALHRATHNMGAALPQSKDSERG